MDRQSIAKKLGREYDHAFTNCPAALPPGAVKAANGMSVMARAEWIAGNVEDVKRQAEAGVEL